MEEERSSGEKRGWSKINLVGRGEGREIVFGRGGDGGS